MKLDIYKSKNSGIKYYLVKSLRGSYALFRRFGVADHPTPFLRRDMVFVESIDVSNK